MLLKNLYSEYTCAATKENKVSQEFNVSKRSKQGCTLVPFPEIITLIKKTQIKFDDLDNPSSTSMIKIYHP